MFGFLPINGHNVNRNLTEINVHLTETSLPTIEQFKQHCPWSALGWVTA
jgi:hypothetical protein